MAEPPITIRAAHDSGPGNGPVTRVVIHATCPDVGYTAASAPGTAHGTALYFATQAAGGSAHYVCGVDGEEHCVPENVIAWHAPPNPGSLGIEITAEGGDYAKNYGRDQWLSPEVWPAVQRAAARARDLCQRHGIPMVRLSPADLLAGKHGICGHVDVAQAWHQSDHSDPNNSTFPWDRFMAEVLGPTPSPVEDDMPRFDLIRDHDNGMEVLAAPGIWRPLSSPSYVKMAAARGLIKSETPDLDVSHSEFKFWQSVYLSGLTTVDPKALAADIVAALPKPDGVSEADVETALRKVLGSLDNPPA